MSTDSIQFDDNGNFVFDDELEVQWMKLHREIQAEYRAEQLRAFLHGMGCVATALVLGYGAVIGMTFLFY